MTIAIKPSLLNLNIIDTTHKVSAVAKAIGKSTYHSIKNATAEDVKDFTLKAATNIGAGALTKAFVGAALAGTAAPVAVGIGITAVSVAAVSTKITHWRDCKKAIANNEEPPKFNWKNYGLKGLFNTAMVGIGAIFSDQILGLFSPSAASADTIMPELNTTEIIPATQPDPAQLFVQGTDEIEKLVPQEDLYVAQPIAPERITPENVVSLAIEEPAAPIIPAMDVINHALPVENLDVITPITAPMTSPLELNVVAQDVIPTIPDVAEITSLQADIIQDELDIAQPVAPEPVKPIVPEIIIPEAANTNIIDVPTLANIDSLATDKPLVIPALETAVTIEPTIPEDTLVSVDVEPETIQPSPLPEISADVTDVSYLIDPVAELQIMDIGPKAEIALESHINGNPQGTADIGYFYFHGEQGLPQDYERAVGFYREAAEADNHFAMRDLSYVETEAEKALGYAVPEPTEAIATDIPEVSSETVAAAPLTLVEELQSIDLGSKAEIALESHINGNTQGTADIGYFYFHGEQGLPQDYEKAVEFYREAAAEGNRFAIRDLEYIESEAEKALGYPVPEAAVEIAAAAPQEPVNVAIDVDIVEFAPPTAVEQLQTIDLGSKAEIALEAHINGNVQGTADIGYFYFHGEQGLPQDYEKAVEFYREAAAEGNRFAMRDLAYIESEAEKALGYAVPAANADIALDTIADSAPSTIDTVVVELQDADLGSKADVALEAHMNGHAQGTADIGYFYFHGEQGLPQDYERAVEFYREAALDGNGFAIRDLAYIESEATKAGIELSEFELPEHLYEKSAPAVQASSPSGSSVRSGLRASCAGHLQAVNGSAPQLQFDCDIRGNNTYIYPGEHVRVNLPNGVSHTFNLDANVGRQSVASFLQNSVLPTATSNYSLN